jgi:PhnB protein
MHIVSYLTFNGNCEEAFKFYEQCLGGKIATMIPHAGTPAEEFVPAEWRHKIMHARLDLDGVPVLMASDAAPDGYQEPKGISVSLHLKDIAKAERILNALGEGGTVQMPFQKTFWAAGFGMVKDRFGIPWMINCENAA